MVRGQEYVLEVVYEVEEVLSRLQEAAELDGVLFPVLRSRKLLMLAHVLLDKAI